MTWVAWRLQRTETLITLGILALLAALLVPTGINMANAYHDSGLGSCVTAVKGASGCDESIGEFQMRFEGLVHLTDWFTLVPGLIGVLLAAPFIFDLEHGTYRLAWTQSITRRSISTAAWTTARTTQKAPSRSATPCSRSGWPSR
jgi:hypothetical protein